MTDENLKKLLKALDEKFKPLHGEVARLSREVADLRSVYIGTRNELSRISKDTARMDSTLDDIRGTLGEHTDKLDAILGDVIDLQNRGG